MAEPTVFRPGAVSYLRIPAPDPKSAADFYAKVFGWTVDTDREDPSFADGSGHVIGHFRADLAVAGDAGVKPYVYVDDVAATLDRAVATGAITSTEPYPEGNLTVATFRDPAGNEIGVWQQGSPG
ncbi:MAG TPA: VOC family protein [Solirubrobacteraceae bacterium]|nr:VOC family protein [Solirubrobacteraceae bacterium]